MYALVAKNAPKDHDVMTDKLFWHHWRFCEGNPQVTDGFLQSPVMQSFDIFFAVIVNKLLKRSGLDGELRRHDAYVTSL